MVDLLSKNLTLTYRIMKISTPALLVVPILYDLFLLFLAVWTLKWNRTSYDVCCGIFLLPSIYLTIKAIQGIKNPKGKKISQTTVLVNIFVLVIFVFSASFRSAWDIDFILRGEAYVSSLDSVDVGEINLSKENAVKLPLPPEYQQLSRYGDIYITKDKDEMSVLVIYLETFIDLDGFVTGYVYAPGVDPGDLPEKCLSGRPVKPNYPDWYFCVLVYDQIFG